MQLPLFAKIGAAAAVMHLAGIFPTVLVHLVAVFALFLAAMKLLIWYGGLRVVPISLEQAHAMVQRYARASETAPCEMETLINFRDFGGYSTRSGGKVRTDVLFRSSTLGNASRRDIESLERLGVKTILDLRTGHEMKKQPTGVLPTGAIKIDVGVESARSLVDTLSHIGSLMRILFAARHELPEGMIGLYTGFVDLAAPWRSVFEHALRSARRNEAILIHCTAGKDRTGLAVTLLLAALGVEREALLSEYTLTNESFGPLCSDFAKNSSMRKIGIPDEHFSPALVARGEWLDGALRHIDEKYGGLEEYLVERVGVPANELEELRSLLVV